MEYFNLTPLLLLVMFSFLICIILLMFFIKVKKSILCFLIIVMISIVGVKIHDRTLNSVFYNFKGEMCRKYPEIINIEISRISGGITCIIYVYIKKEMVNENAESIFVDMLKEFNQEPMSSYLKDRSGWVELNVDFRGAEWESFDSGSYSHSDWFTKENQQEQTWHNSKTGKEYRYSDYIE